MSHDPSRKPTSPAVLHKLAKQHLAPAGALLGADARSPRVAECLGRCGHGLHILQGEHVVAFLDLGDEGPHFQGAILTDRTLLTACSDEVGRVPLAQVTKATAKEGWLACSLLLETTSGDLELSLATHLKPLAALLNELAALRYAPQDRPSPWVVARPDDPSGLRHLADSLTDPDPRLLALLQRIHDDPKADPHHRADRVARAALLHRVLAYGRPMHDGRWLCALRRPALAAALASTSSQPTKTDTGRLSTTLEINPRPHSGGLLPDRADLEERLLASVLDRVSKKAVGVELSDVLDEDAVHLRLVLDDGPSTDDLLQTEAEAHAAPTPPTTESSVWAHLKKLPHLAQNLLGASHADPLGTLTLLRVEGFLGGRFVDLAQRRPLQVHHLLAPLLDLELQGV